MAVFGMLTPFHRPEPEGSRFHARLAIDGETYDLVTDGARLSTRRRPADEPDVTVKASARDIVAARQGRQPLPGSAGDAGVERFARLFQLA